MEGAVKADIRYLRSFSMDRELVLEFFLCLSRAEFALKRCGYLHSGSNGNARPSWRDFQRDLASIQEEFEARVEVAIDYYLEHPPKKQKVRNGKLCWEPCESTLGSRIADAVFHVQTARNNLFHGGKYDSRDHDEVARNHQLLSYGIAIIEAAIEYFPNLKKAYDGA